MRQNLIAELTDPSLNEYGYSYEIMEIAEKEMRCMVCNGFCLRSNRGKHVITMSKQAYDGCSDKHLAVLKENY